MPERSQVLCLARSILLSAVALLLSCAPARAADEFPPELVRFQPYTQNPVFRGAGGQAWDAKIRERGWILRDIESASAA